jgi:hypothetical protein
LQSQPFEAKLHLVYLLNDVLNMFGKKRQVSTTLDPFAAGLLPHLLAVFDTACRGHTTDQRTRVLQVMKLWGQKAIYPAVIIKDIEAKVSSDAPVPLYAGQVAPVAHQTHMIPLHGGYSVPHAQHHQPVPTPQYAPPQVSAPQFAPPPAHHMPPQRSAAPTPHTSTLHLGPGFIVTITKSNPPYTPLDPLTVPSHIPPEYITPPDAYLLSRVDRFYADLEGRGKRRRSRSRSRSPPRRRSRSPKRLGLSAVRPPQAS